MENNSNIVRYLVKDHTTAATFEVQSFKIFNLESVTSTRNKFLSVTEYKSSKKIKEKVQ